MHSLLERSVHYGQLRQKQMGLCGHIRVKTLLLVKAKAIRGGIQELAAKDIGLKGKDDERVIPVKLEYCVAILLEEFFLEIHVFVT